MTVIAPLSLINGFVFPYSTMGLLGVYLVGRYLYTSGYNEKEGALNNKRMIGSLLCNFAHMGTLAISLLIGIKLARGKGINPLPTK